MQQRMRLVVPLTLLLVRISSPMFGGLVSLTLLTLIVVPVIYLLYARRAVIGGSIGGRGPSSAA